MTAETSPHHHSLRQRLRFYLSIKIAFRRSEIVKYALAAFCIFLPGLMRFFHYFTWPCLCTFIACFCLSFGLLLIFQPRRQWLIPLIAVGIFGAAYHLALGKPLGYQTLTAMYETNLHEILGFLGSPYSIPLILGGAAALGGMLWVIVGDRTLPGLGQATFVRRKYLLPLLLISAVLFLATNWKVRQTYPVCLFYNNFTYIDENITRQDYTENAYRPPANLERAPQADELYLLVIGESARRSSLSAYGYPRKTSPELDRMLVEKPDNTMLYTDATSTSPFTKASVMSIYSPLTIAEELQQIHTKPSLSRIFRGCGFDTLYVTCRPQYLAPNMLSTFLDDAEHAEYLSAPTKMKYDEAVLPLVEAFANNHSGKRKWIVVHLMGSHIKYDMQYPKGFAPFPVNPDRSMLDTYDTSIRYSDQVLRQIVDIVLRHPQPGCLLYLSDHGENLNDKGDGNFGHGTRALTKFELDVPFVFFCNDAFLQQRPGTAAELRAHRQLPVYHDDVAHTFLGLAGIRDPALYREAFDLSSPAFHPGIRYITDENMNVFDYATFDFNQKAPLQEFTETLEAKYLAKFDNSDGPEALRRHPAAEAAPR